ncbi:MAG: hypothetical protein ACO31K_05960 [Schleiferiaceae bacterium]
MRLMMCWVDRIMLVKIEPASQEYITGFGKAKGVFREVVREPNFHALDVYIEHSDDTSWVDGRRKENKDGTMSHIAVEVMVDVKPLSVVEDKGDNGVVTLRRAPALDIRVGNDIRFDPKLLQVELGKFQFVVGGASIPIHDIKCATILGKEALDAYFKVSGHVFFNDEVTKELRKKEKNDADFDRHNTENIKAVEHQVYNYYLDKTVKNYHEQLKALVDNKTLVPTYLRLHAQLEEGQSICRTTNYLNGRRLIVATIAGNTSCAAVGSGGMMGVFQDEPVVLSEAMIEAGKAWLKPYESTIKYTAATKLTQTDTAYSKKGLIEAMTEKAKSAATTKKRKSPEPEKKEEKICAEIHPMGVSGVNFFGAQCFLTLQCKGAPTRPVQYKCFSAAPSGTRGITRGGGSDRSVEPVDTTVRHAKEVKVMAMNLSPGTKVEKTPLPVDSIPPWEDQIQGATCFFITNAKLSAVADDGKATSVLKATFTADAVRPSLKQAVDVFEGLADAVSTGAGFQNLSDSKCIVKEEDMTAEQKAIEQQAQMKINELSVSELLKCSDQEVMDMASTPAEVQYKPPEIDYEALKAKGLQVGTTGAFDHPILPLPDGYYACGAGGLAVLVKEHDGEDDDNGCRLEAVVVEIEGSKHEHTKVSFKATESWLIRVTAKNIGSKAYSFIPVYVDCDGREVPEDKIDLGYGEEVELPYAITADLDGQCHWTLRDPTTNKRRATLSFNQA